MSRQWSWTKRQFGPIGLDIGHDSIKMLQLVRDAQRLSIHRLLSRRTPQATDEESQRQGLILTIKKMLEEGDFRGTEVALCLANDKLKVTSVRLSESDVAKTTAQLYKEAALRFGLDPGRDSIQYIPAGLVHQGDQTRQEVVLFGAERSAMDESLALLDAVQLTAVGLEPVPCALARGLRRALRREEDHTGTLVLVDVGSRTTTVVVTRLGEISFVKVIGAGAERFDQEIAAKLGVQRTETETWRKAWRAAEAEEQEVGPLPPTAAAEDSSCAPCHRRPLDASVVRALTDAIRSAADALAREVALCARYYTVTFRGQRIERTVVSGGGACEPLLLSMIRAQVGSEVEAAAPLRGMENFSLAEDGRTKEGGPEWALAFGLALKGWLPQNESIGPENSRRSLVPAL